MARNGNRVEVDSRDLERALRRFSRSGVNATGRAAHDAATAAGDRARSAVPKRTGRLAGSISVQRDQDGARLEMGGAGVPYAGWIEYGGSRGRPYVAGGRYVGRATEHADRDFARRTEQALAQIGRQL